MRFIIFALALFIATAAQAETLTIGTLNTESGSDTQPFKVAETIRGIGQVDVWAFQEVANIDAAVEFTVAAGAASNRKSYRYVISESGEISQPHRRHDFLAIAYNSSRLRQVETVELHGIRSKPGAGRLGNADWHLRGALFVRLQDTSIGVEFYVGNVHLKCCGSGVGIRAHQAEIIREWISRADVPVILTGDFNIPVAPTSATGNQGSAAFTTLEQAATWLRPSNPVKTQCSPSFNSMLDLFFLTDGPNITIDDVEVREVDPSYCDADAEGYADHRPVIASASRQRLAIISQPQRCHTGAGAAVKAFRLVASLCMDAPVRRRYADPPRLVLTFGHFFGPTTRQDSSDNCPVVHDTNISQPASRTSYRAHELCNPRI